MYCNFKCAVYSMLSKDRIEQCTWDSHSALHQLISLLNRRLLTLRGFILEISQLKSENIIKVIPNLKKGNVMNLGGY